MAVTMTDISKLRKLTGAGMMDCKKALEETNCDMDAAVEIIRKKGQAVAAKREDREASEGCVLSAAEGNFCALVALKCETDFVAKNEGFVALTKSILDAAMAAKAKSLDEVKALVIDGRTVADLIVDEIGKTGEKIELGAYECLEGEGTTCYDHLGNKLSTIVTFTKPVERQVGRNVAMQVASMNPISVSRDSVPQNVIDQELDIAREKARQEGKKEEMLDKIAQGRLNKFYKESCLVEQEYIMDPALTIASYLKGIDADLTVKEFKRVNLNID